MISSALVVGDLLPFAGRAEKKGQVSSPALLSVGAFSKVMGNRGKRVR
jgi:hypothetical protein